MRLLWCFLLCTAFFVAGCKKNRLNQPSYLNFSWRFTENSGSIVDLKGGKFTATQISISGDRKEGDDIDINQSLPSVETSFSSDDALNVQIDVPVGEYLSFVSSLKMAANTTAAVTLTGTLNKGGGVFIPLRIELSEADILNFAAQQSFTLDKKHTYSVYLQLVASKLFQDISNDMWSASMLTNEPDGPTLVVSEQSNHPLYNHINSRLSEALTLSVE